MWGIRAFRSTTSDILEKRNIGNGSGRLEGVLETVAGDVPCRTLPCVEPKTHFHQINRKTGNRLRQQMVDQETGKPFDKDEKGRGYEVSKGKYVEIEPEEMEAVEVESTHTLDIDTFVPEEEIDKRYYAPYCIVPSGEEVFAVIRDAMEGQGPGGTFRPSSHGARACSVRRCAAIMRC